MNRRIDWHPLGKGEEALIDLLALVCGLWLGKEMASREAKRWKEAIMLGRIIGGLDHHKTLLYRDLDDLLRQVNPEDKRGIGIYTTFFEIANFIVITPNKCAPNKDDEPWHLGRITATEGEIYDAVIYGPVRVRVELEKTEFFGLSALTGEQIQIHDIGSGHTDDLQCEFRDLPIIPPDVPHARDLIGRAGGLHDLLDD